MDEETRAKYAQNGEVMLASAILLFFLVLIIIFLHTYGHLCLCHRRRHLRRNTDHFYPHLIIPTSSSIRTTTTTTATSNKALELSILNLLPTFTYTSATHRPLQECAVCLSEFEDDDEGRVLPNCNHAFHCHCIDTWFRSHSNCPLCRAPVRPPKIEPVESVSSSDIEPTLSLSVIGSHSESQAGCSTLPPPIGCPRKPLELVGMVGVIVELPSVRRR